MMEIFIASELGFLNLAKMLTIQTSYFLVFSEKHHKQFMKMQLNLEHSFLTFHLFRHALIMGHGCNKDNEMTH